MVLGLGAPEARKGMRSPRLDEAEAIQEEVRNAARTLGEAVKAKRSVHLILPGRQLQEPRAK